jgi:HrpA-like RNA helicase
MRSAAHGTSKNDDTNKTSNQHIELSPRATEQIDNRFIRALIIKIIEEEQQQQSKEMFNKTTTEEEDCGKYRTSGAILVFLPGLGEIESLARCLYEEKGTIVSNRDKCKIMKLHSSIPKAEQRRVFQPALVGTTKVVLATNIAEVSEGHTVYTIFSSYSLS